MVGGTVYIDGGKTGVASTVTLTGYSPTNQGSMENWGADDLIIDAGDTLILESWFDGNVITTTAA